MQSGTHKLKIAFSVTNCICHDQRVLKMAGAAEKAGGEATIIGRKLGPCCENETVPFRARRFRMVIRKGFLFYMFFNLRLFFYLLFHKFDILVANDLDTLLPNFLASRLKGRKLVFDSHEYFTGVPEVECRPFIKRVWKSIEKTILPKLRFTLTVSDSISEQYFSEYGIRPLVVRNCGLQSSSIMPYSRNELGINPDHLLLVLQGTGINRDRGGEELIESLLLYGNHSLLIIGGGDVIPELVSKTEKLNLSGRIKFFPKLPWHEMMRYTKSADAGVSLDRLISLNHRFSLPNKLFDYISAGIPVIAGSLPEIIKIIEGNECGILIPDITPAEISNAVARLREDSMLLNKLKQNAVNASVTLNWENEQKKVIDFYKQVIKQ